MLMRRLSRDTTQATPLSTSDRRSNAASKLRFNVAMMSVLKMKMTHPMSQKTLQAKTTSRAVPNRGLRVPRIIRGPIAARMGAV